MKDTTVKTEIEKIKDIVAQRKGYLNWIDYYNWIARDGEYPSVVAQLIEGAMTEVLEEYRSQPSTSISDGEIEAMAKENYPDATTEPDMATILLFRSIWKRGYKAALQSSPSVSDERLRIAAEAAGFFTMQQFPSQELGETFSKTVLIYNKEDNTFCDLGYYDFETSEWAILGDMSMKLICWCYIPDASNFIKGKELKEELHRGYC